jgi:hypothetical protein
MAHEFLPNTYLEIGAKVASNFELEIFASLILTTSLLTLSFPIAKSIS